MNSSNMMQNTERFPVETAREYAFRVLKDNIINLVLEPGMMVSEVKLGQELELSRTPVREALLELCKQKLVEIYPQKGSFISKIDYHLIEEARYLRYIIETSIVETVCERRTEEDLFWLNERIVLQKFYEDSGQKDKVLKTDNEFHTMLYAIAGKKMLQQMVESSMVHFDRIRRVAIETRRNYRVIEDHEEILDAIRKQDKKKARALVAVHLSRYQVEQEEIRRKYPEWIASSSSN